MITFEEYQSKNAAIKITSDKKFEVFVLEESIGRFGSMLEAQDMLIDAVTEDLKSDHNFHCDFCNIYFKDEKEVNWRISEPNTSLYGSLLRVDRGTAYPVCPNCDDEVDEV
jgi:hypothetical protein